MQRFRQVFLEETKNRLRVIKRELDQTVRDWKGKPLKHNIKDGLIYIDGLPKPLKMLGHKSDND